MTNDELIAQMRQSDGSLTVVVAVMTPDGNVAQYPVTRAATGPADYGQQVILSLTTATET